LQMLLEITSGYTLMEQRALVRVANISNHLLASQADELIPHHTSAEVLRELLNHKSQPDYKPNTTTITVEQFKGLVGKEVGVSSWFQISQERVNTFADATGDHQWIHIDVERAKAESPFGGPIAHGFLTLSLLPMLVSEAMPKISGIKMGVNYGMNKLRFVSPAPVGCKVRARVALGEFQEVKGGGQSVLKVTIEKEGDDKPVLLAEWISRYYF